MREPNPRVRPKEKLELALDGRHVASVVVGALVLLGVVFVLGLNVGKQIALRQAEAHPAGDLDALDRAPAVAAPVKPEALTFHERLTRDGPPQASPAVAPAPAPLPAAAARPVEAASTDPAPVAPAAVPAPPPAAAPAAPAERPWTVQLAAAQDRAEAERLATRFAALDARVEPADVPGKGRFYRVRVGGFDTREGAESYLRDVTRETGAKGFVTPSR